MTILITGAGSGIGQGLAHRLSRPHQTLFLGDLHSDSLDLTQAQCSSLGAVVHTRCIDARDRTEMAEWISESGRSRLDMVFACAGLTGGLPPSHGQPLVMEREEHARAIFETNLTGALNTLFPAIEQMRQQKPDRNGHRGRICVMSSVASFVSYPGTPSYSASKAAIDRFVVASAPSLERQGISLTSVCCGFVKTPMVRANRFPMPGLVSTEEAVHRILRGTLRGQRRIMFPFWLGLGARLTDLLPPRLAERYYCRQPSAQPGGMPDY